jgi:hypothetical protein
VIESDGVHWVVEVKMDREMASEDVKGKREAAKRWANYVTADDKVTTGVSQVTSCQPGQTTASCLAKPGDHNTPSESCPCLPLR